MNMLSRSKSKKAPYAPYAPVSVSPSVNKLDKYALKKALYILPPKKEKTNLHVLFETFHKYNFAGKYLFVFVSFVARKKRKERFKISILQKVISSSYKKVDNINLNGNIQSIVQLM